MILPLGKTWYFKVIFGTYFGEMFSYFGKFTKKYHVAWIIDSKKPQGDYQGLAQ